MTPDVVVDIGNSRMKWGLCREGRVTQLVSLAGDIPEDWSLQVPKWNLSAGLTWAVAGVQPAWQRLFTRWAEARDGRVVQITHGHIPLPIEVDEPESVGIDRLLNALAASRRVPRNSPAIVISVGTAVTVDLLAANCSFMGGTIFPGPRLMAESLHRFTAKLPRVHLDRVAGGNPPGKNTRNAIEAGISFAIVGGASLLVDAMTGAEKDRTWVILTGGGLGTLAAFHFGTVANTVTEPTLTLDGIRIAAEALP